MLTVKSGTSGNPLLASVIDTSEWRKYLGFRHLKVIVLSDPLGLEKARLGSSSWYYPSEVNGYEG